MSKLEPVGPTETPNNISHSSFDLGQDRRNAFSIDNPRLVERYIKNELHIIFDVTLKDGEQYAALLQRESSALGRDKATFHLGSDIAPRVAPEIDFSEFGSLAWQNRMKLMPCPGGKQQPVLVDIVKAMESPERLIPSIVWVERMDTFLSLWPQTFYFSVEEGLCVFRGTVRNRERRGTSGSHCCPVKLRGGGCK